MATIIFSDLVKKVSGKVKNITFSKVRSGYIVKEKQTFKAGVIFSTNNSKNAFARCVNLWQQMTVTIKLNWDLFKSTTQRSGYHSFISNIRTQEQSFSLLSLSSSHIDYDLTSFTAIISSDPFFIKIDFLPYQLTINTTLIIIIRLKPVLSDKVSILEYTFFNSQEVSPIYLPSPFLIGTYQVYGMLQDDSENLTGISKASEIIVLTVNGYGTETYGTGTYGTGRT